MNDSWPDAITDFFEPADFLFVASAVGDAWTQDVADTTAPDAPVAAVLARDGPATELLWAVVP